MTAESSDQVLFGTSVSDMQTGLRVSGEKITGTLKYLNSGALVTRWGAGNFMALKFGSQNPGKIEVGLDPSQSSGLVELDEDMNGVFKVTATTQKFKVVSTSGTDTLTQVFDLSGLTLTGA